MKSTRWLGLSLAMLFGFLCGCGNNDGSAKPTVISYSASTPVYTKDVAITPDRPAVNGGIVAGYSIAPALPAGLVLDPNTGVISGTPSVVSAKSTYTVTATAASGASSATLTITVNDQPPIRLTYAAGTAAYTVAVPITPNSPANSGGAVVSYTVSPALPSGLILSTTTGIISGTPAAEVAAAKYTVTGANTGGSTTAVITIAINAPQSQEGPLPPSGLAYHPGSAIYTVGVPIPGNAPASTGGAPRSYTSSLGVPVPAYSISPPLPLGLRISGTPVTLGDNATGVISGVPAAASPRTTYTVTASNLSGSTTATLDLTVNAAGASPSGLAYAFPAPVYGAGVEITPDAPLANSTITAGSIFSVSPDLPSGLSIDPATGIVRGTPNAVPSTIIPPPPSTATYTVTATDAAGNSTTAPLTITIFNAPQAVPNMAQSITPLETPGSNFQFLDTGMVVTDTFDPRVPPKEWLAGQAVSTSISPDGNTLLVLTSGFNRVYQGPFPLFDPLYSSEYIFIFDISSHSPVFTQAVPVPNAYHGIVWDPVPGNHAFYVSGGMGDAPFGTDPIPYPLPNNGDNIHIVQLQSDGTWRSVAELGLGQSPSTPVQGHPSGNGLPVPNNQFASVNSAVFVAPMAAGLAISPDGRTLVVANYYNDSITVFTGGLDVWKSQWVADPASAQGFQGTLSGMELDLRPGKAASGASPGTPGGEYPFWVVFKGDSGPGATVYVSTLRDREIDVVNLGETCAHGTTGPNCFLAVAPVVSARIPVKGQPNKMAINRAGTLLYVAEDQSDTVDVIDINPQDVGIPYQNQPATVNTVIETIPVIAPPADMASFSLTQFTGANTNGVTLSPDENTLYVTNGNLNNIAVVNLNGTNRGDQVAGF